MVEDSVLGLCAILNECFKWLVESNAQYILLWSKSTACAKNLILKSSEVEPPEKSPASIVKAPCVESVALSKQ